MKIVKTPVVFIEMTPNALDALTSTLSEILRSGTNVVAEYRQDTSEMNTAMKSMGMDAKTRKQKLKEDYKDIAYASTKLKTLSEIQRQLKRGKSNSR